MVLDPFNPMDFPGAALDWGVDHYVVRLDRPYKFLSSALIGEGFIESRWVISQQVSADASLTDPEPCLREAARVQGIPRKARFVGLLTAVSHRDLQVYTVEESGVAVATLVTAGVDHGSSPLEKHVSSHGEPAEQPEEAVSPVGTINIVTLVDANLTPGALVRASTIITEAKTLALVQAGLKTRQGHPTSGTPTDVTVVGHTGRGCSFKYAGSATLVGWLVGHAAYHCVKEGLAAYNRRKQRDQRSMTA